jgi:very-short-patch-repair endonuclease
MPVRARLPPQLATSPFRGSDAISGGLLTPAMLRGRSWQRLFPDVYLHRDVAMDHRTWCTAVGLILPPDAAIGGLSAAFLWGVDLLAPDAPVSVLTKRTAWMFRHERVRTHYSAIDDGDLTSWDGSMVSSPERTAFDLGRRLGRAGGLMVLDGLAHSGVADLGVVAELASRRYWWPGIPKLNELLRIADPRTESPMESRLRLLLHDAGLPQGRPQFEIRNVRGLLIGRVDLGWPAARLAVEYEGDHHRERDQFRRDIDRVNALRMAGWTVLRLTADDVLRRPDRTVAMVAAELARLS